MPAAGTHPSDRIMNLKAAIHRIVVGFALLMHMISQVVGIREDIISSSRQAAGVFFCSGVVVDQAIGWYPVLGRLRLQDAFVIAIS